jgi:DNA-binding transcriptional LysR family regulator
MAEPLLALCANAVVENAKTAQLNKSVFTVLVPICFIIFSLFIKFENRNNDYRFAFTQLEWQIIKNFFSYMRITMQLDADNLRLFATVAHYGSFSKAALSLEIPVSTISRRLSQLEDQLSLKLIDRHPRGVALTEAGDQMLGYAQNIQSQVEQAKACLLQYNDEPSGKLRIAMPASIGNQVAADVINHYRALCPNVSLELQLTDRKIDLVADAYDLIFVYGPLPDSAMVAKKIFSAKAKLVATPQFLESHSVLNPNDLSKLPCIVNSTKETNVKWTFFKSNEHISVKPNAHIQINSSDIVKQSVLSHHGMTLLPADLCKEELETGKLVTVLDDWTCPDWEIYVIFSSRDNIPKKTRLFLDMVTQVANAQYGK